MRSTQTQTPRPTSTNLSGSQVLTYYTYLLIINEPFFDLVSFSTTGPGFAVPAIDDRYIYVGSGFGNYCQNKGQIQAIDDNRILVLLSFRLQ